MKSLQYVLAGVAVSAAVLLAAVVAYDRGRSHDDRPGVSYRVDVAGDPSDVAPVDAATLDLDLGRLNVDVAGWSSLRIDPSRKGCEAYGPNKTVCDLRVAFPDVGLTGRALFDRA